MKKILDDCWMPLPGSWEELVEPYDRQRARLESEKPAADQQQLPLEVVSEPQPRPVYPIPASV